MNQYLRLQVYTLPILLIALPYGLNWLTEQEIRRSETGTDADLGLAVFGGIWATVLWVVFTPLFIASVVALWQWRRGNQKTALMVQILILLLLALLSIWFGSSWTSYSTAVTLLLILSALIPYIGDRNLRVTAK